MLASLIVALGQLQNALDSHELVAVNTNIAYAEVIGTSSPVLEPALVPICACESVGNPQAVPAQYDTKGNVLRGTVNPHDVGMCQINTDHHGAEAKKLGYNVETQEGNIEYANFLYEREGTQPWSSSRKCWKAAAAKIVDNGH